MRYFTFIVVLLVFAFRTIYAQQNITGKVYDENNQELYGANVYVIDLHTGAQTDFNGKFEIEDIPNKIKEVKVKFSYVGYKTQEIKVQLPQKREINVKLDIEPVKTGEVVVTENREGVFLKNSPVKIEVITARQIEKNYSIDLTQACQYTPGIKVQDNCGVCGTTDIRIEGLKGQYSQFLINGHPIMSNLGTVYGLMGINSSNIKQIEVVKGPGSILYGPEAVSGTINIILKEPSDLPPISAEFTGTSDLEHSISLSGVQKWNNTASSMTFNYSGNSKRIDKNGDGFTDTPLFQRYALINQWQTNFNNNLSAKVFGRYYYEDRFGGQMNWNKSDRGGSKVYGESIYTNRGELFGGITNTFSKTDKMQLDFSGVFHHQNSCYGETHYDAKQITSYIDLVSIHKFTDDNTATFGAAYKYDKYDDNTPATVNPSYSNIFSLFAQDELKLTDNVTTLLGLRYNYHNIQKSIWQPRASIKVSPTPLTNIRLSFGTGFRTVNLFTEDHASYTGTRDVVVKGSLKPERSINTSLSIVQDLDFNKTFIAIELAGHYTRFSNQIIPDYDTDPKKIIYENLNGYSISRGFEASIKYEHLVIPVKFKVSYEFLEAFKEEDNLRSEIEFNPRHTVNIEADYDFNNIGLTLNVTGKWVGKQKLPLFLEPYPRPTTSDPYSVWNVNLTKDIGGIALSLGMNNIFDYTQPSPLIDPQHPFGKYFDTVYVYAPLLGRQLTAGLRFNLNKL